MAQLEITLGGGDVLVFSFLTVRTADLRVTPEYDTLSGKFFECNRIDFELVGICNSVAIATNKPNPFAVGRTDAPFGPIPDGKVALNGDTLAFSLQNLREILAQPRRSIVFRVADEPVIQLPRVSAGGTTFDGDCRGGPFVDFASYSPIIGDKSAIMRLKYRCYDTRQEQIMLSNVWSVISDINPQGYTTRSLRGRANFRVDLLRATDLSADDFRKVLMVGCPEGMRREGVNATLSADGMTLDYSIQDVEVIYGLGRESNITKVTGSATSTCAYPFRSVKDLVNTVVGFAGQAWDLNLFGAIKAAWAGVVPVATNVAVARAEGNKNADRLTLASTAMAICLDRFSPILRGNPSAIQTLASVTQGIDSEGTKWAEARVELFGLDNAAIGNMLRLEPAGMQKWSDDFNDLRWVAPAAIGGAAGGGQVNIPAPWGPRVPATELPASNNTRGTALYRMIIQGLSAPTPANTPTAANLPDDPPANQNAVDVDKI